MPAAVAGLAWRLELLLCPFFLAVVGLRQAAKERHEVLDDRPKPSCVLEVVLSIG